MQKHAVIMVHAYSRVAERTLEESLADLNLAGIVELDEISSLPESENDYLEAMMKDPEMILSWKNPLS